MRTGSTVRRSVRSPNRRRLLFLGDSVIYYGDSVADTVPGHMQQALIADPAVPALDVINAGIRGYTNYQELLYLKKFGFAFEPDVIGVEFCLNDLHQFLHSFEVRNGKLVLGRTDSRRAAVGDAGHWLSRVGDKSVLVQWLGGRLNLASRAIEHGSRWGIPVGTRSIRLSVARESRGHRLNSNSPTCERRRTSEAPHSSSHFFPVCWQSMPDTWTRIGSGCCSQRRLREICQKLRIPFYDLYPDLAGNLFEDDQMHLTAAGRAKAGGALKTFVTSAGILRGRE